MRPAGDASLRAERRHELVVTEGPEEVVLQVVRARPHELDRPAGQLGDERRLGDEVVGQAPPESAARARHLDADRRARDAGHRVHRARGAGRLLQGRDDSRPVRLHVDERAGRLERRVAHERDAVARLDDLGGVAGRGVEVAVVVHDLAALREELRALGIERRARLGGERAARPLDRERVAALERGPHVVGDDRNAGREVRRERLARLRARYHDDRAHPGHRACRTVVEPRDAAVEIGATQHDGRARLRFVHVDAVARAARDDLLGIDDAAWPTDDPVLGGRLERHRLEGQCQLRRSRHERTVWQPPAIGVQRMAGIGLHVRERNAPLARPRPGA